MFFALAAEGRFKRAVLGDVNQELVNAYIALTIGVDRVIRALEKHVYKKKYYYAGAGSRSEQSQLGWSRGAAHLLE